MRKIQDSACITVRVLGSYRNFASLDSLARFLSVPSVCFRPNRTCTGWDCWACEDNVPVCDWTHIVGRLACVSSPECADDIIVQSGDSPMLVIRA